MLLLLADLDNTLIDRAAAFTGWAHDFAAAHGRGLADGRWLVNADRDGREPRERLAAAAREHFGLDARGEASLLAELRGGMVSRLVLDDEVGKALRAAREARLGAVRRD